MKVLRPLFVFLIACLTCIGLVSAADTPATSVAPANTVKSDVNLTAAALPAPQMLLSEDISVAGESANVIVYVDLSETEALAAVNGKSPDGRWRAANPQELRNILDAGGSLLSSKIAEYEKNLANTTNGRHDFATLGIVKVKQSQSDQKVALAANGPNPGS